MGIEAWDVDDRPMTLLTRCYVLGMRLARDKRAFEGAEHTLAGARERQRQGSAPPTWTTRLSRRVTVAEEEGMRVWRVRPRRWQPVVTVLYVHGGGYVHPLTADYWRLVRSLSRTPAEIVVPDYPLAPGATLDLVLPRLLALSRSVAGRGRPVVLMGDSAGGALVVTMARHLRHDPDRPVRVVALCPWLDATLDEQAVAELESTDPMLAESGLRAAGRWWAGDRDPRDPDVSPDAATDLDGLPPLDVLIGDRDILRPGVDVLAERLRTATMTPLRVREVPAMFHVWMTRAIPEGRRTRRELVALMRDVAASR